MSGAQRATTVAAVLALLAVGSAPAAGAYRLKGPRLAYVGQAVTLRVSPKPPVGTRFSWGASITFPDFSVPKNARSRVLRHRFDHTGTFTVTAQFTTGPGLSGLHMLTRRVRVRSRASDPTNYCNDSRGDDSIGRFAAYIATSSDCATAYGVLDQWLADGGSTDNSFLDPWTYDRYSRARDRLLVRNPAGEFIRFAYYVNGD